MKYRYMVLVADSKEGQWTHVFGTSHETILVKDYYPPELRISDGNRLKAVFRTWDAFVIEEETND